MYLAPILQDNTISYHEIFSQYSFVLPHTRPNEKYATVLLGWPPLFQNGLWV